MKSVLISINPKWCELIASGKKTVEVRKTAPKEVPFKAYIYQTKKRWIYKILPFLKMRQAKVIGEFICDKVDKISLAVGRYMINKDIAYTNGVANKSCLYFEDLQKYLGNKNGYAWHISELKIYDEPRELGEFKKYNRVCKFSDLGYAIPNCKTCRDCNLTRPPQSWCYILE